MGPDPGHPALIEALWAKPMARALQWRVARTVGRDRGSAVDQAVRCTARWAWASGWRSLSRTARQLGHECSGDRHGELEGLPARLAQELAAGPLRTPPSRGQPVDEFELPAPPDGEMPAPTSGRPCGAFRRHATFRPRGGGPRPKDTGRGRGTTK